MPTSLLTPFQIVGGRIGTTTDTVTQVQQKILTTLTTDLLERVGIPDFGVGINQLLFGNIDDLVSADFRVDALTEFSDRISGVEVVDVRVTSQEETTANISVLYKLPLSATRQVSFQVALPGSFTEESGF